MGLDRSTIGTFLELVGIASVVIGCALLSTAVAFIVGGLLLVLFGAAES